MCIHVHACMCSVSTRVCIHVHACMCTISTFVCVYKCVHACSWLAHLCVCIHVRAGQLNFICPFKCIVFTVYFLKMLFFIYKFLFGGCRLQYAEVRGQLVGTVSLFLPCGSQGSGGQSRQKVLLTLKLSYWSSLSILCVSYTWVFNYLSSILRKTGAD